VPAALPPATFADSVEAADHLVRLPGVVVLVDGYNVAMLRWPEQAVAEQRRRLVDSLGELAARTGAEVQVVFDGAEQVEPPAVPGPRRPVRVSFSPPGTEADDVIIERTADLPVHRPVVVVSSDQRVQRGAAANGANVISSPQLLAVMGR
jgi:predicted RNA-binding protein with PIN domain